MSAHEQALKIVTAAGLANEKMLDGAVDILVDISAAALKERAQRDQAKKQMEDAQKWAEAQNKVNSD